jgi:Domain of unknown function (DUF5071)
MDLKECVPRDKFDSKAVERAIEIGFPGINPILAELLEWVQDANWPVARKLFDLLAQAGPEITPHINRVFRGEDECWKYFILVCLVRDLKPEVAELLKPEIVRMANTPTASEKRGEVDDAARDALEHWDWQAT